MSEYDDGGQQPAKNGITLSAVRILSQWLSVHEPSGKVTASVAEGSQRLLHLMRM